MKKLFCLAICLLLCLLACAAVADTEYQEGVYRFSINEEKGEATILQLLENYAMVKVPDTLHDCPVTAIGSRAFYGSPRLERAVLPKSVTTIGDYAFAACSELNTVEMPGVETIGVSAFEGSAIHEVKLPATLTSVGKRAFAQCLRLYSIELPGSLTSVSEEMFCDSRFLCNVTLREGVAVLEDKAFCGCAALEKLALPMSLAELGVNPLIGCTKLKNIQVSAQHPVLKVVDGALIYTPDARLVSYAAGLKARSFTVPAEVRSIGVAAFCESYQLQQVTVPATVETVGDYAFWYCTNLTAVTVADGVAVHPTAFAECYALVNADVPQDAELPALPVDPKL